jgi:hypothetical protein
MADFLDAQSSEFDERNLFLFLSLGLLSIGDRLESLLRRYAPEHAEQRMKPLVSDAEPFVYLALGAIHVCDVVRRELGAASTRASKVDVGSPPPAWPDTIGDVLR